MDSGIFPLALADSRKALLSMVQLWLHSGVKNGTGRSDFGALA
jgi:hypothetical protein